MDRLFDYQRKCIVLKQIQSNKVNLYRIFGNIQKFLTVFVSAFITFLGFSGTDKISKYIQELFKINISLISIELIFNLLIFILFLSTLTHLLFQFDNKQKDAEKSIILLTALQNEIENYQNNFNESSKSSINVVAEKYEQLIHTLPSNSDRDFLRAKKDLKRKEVEQAKIGKSASYPLDGESLTERELKKELIKIINADEYTRRIIDFVYELSNNFYVGGGIIRNLVWDRQHRYKIQTPLDDIDIIYFDKTNATKQHDDAIEKEIRFLLPNIDWSVKNQARMHAINGDSEYKDITDAVSKWPETASAILVKKDRFGKYKIIAPHGLKDLFALHIRPTPAFVNKTNRIYERCKSKKWKEKWPNLKIDL